MLSGLLFLPLAGAALLLFLPAEKPGLLRGAALALSSAAFALSVVLFVRFDGAAAGAQFVERRAWLGYGIRYEIGIDGLSLPLVMLTTFLAPLVLLSSRRSIRNRTKSFTCLFLMLETALIGVFVSLDLFLFYIFWEAVLIPMYFLIGGWGGPRRLQATLKFVIFTMAGSLLFLAGLIVLARLYHGATGDYSYAFADLYRLALAPGVQTGLFLAFAVAFAVKVPLFPLHTWLPDAHVEAPTAASVFLAAVLLKMGAYGFLRLALPLFPDAARRFLPALSILAVIGIIYGGFMALVQKDMKSLVAYSSVSHMGLVCLAVFALNPEALQGALFQMVNHGLSTGALFLCVGFLYERAHVRGLDDFGGVARMMPVLAALTLVSALSSMGLPGLSGFAGEILCLFGIGRNSILLAALAASTLVLSAAYLLGFMRRVFHGPAEKKAVLELRDLDGRELATLIPLILLMIGLGLFPGILLRKTDGSAAAYFRLIQKPDRAVAVVPLHLHPAPAIVSGGIGKGP